MLGADTLSWWVLVVTVVVGVGVAMTGMYVIGLENGKYRESYEG